MSNRADLTSGDVPVGECEDEVDAIDATLVTRFKGPGAAREAAFLLLISIHAAISIVQVKLNIKPNRMVLRLFILVIIICLL